MQKVCIELYNGDKINLNLYEEYAPFTVVNFLHLIDIHFYDNLIFHRIIKGFMGQGGGYFIKDNVITEKTVNYTILGEFVNNGFNNTLSHTAGVISMARTEEVNSASTQFFICDEDSQFLDGNYAAFGKFADEESLTNIRKLCAIPTTAINEHITDFPVSDDIANITIKTIYRLDN